MGGIFPRRRRDGDGCGDAAVPSDRRIASSIIANKSCVIFFIEAKFLFIIKSFFIASVIMIGGMLLPCSEATLLPRNTHAKMILRCSR